MKKTFLLILIFFALKISAGEVLILNEDWYGNRNSSMNAISDAGEFSYNIIREANAEEKFSLGCTAQFGAVFGDKLYVIAKQAQDSGEGEFKGARVVVADLATKKIVARIETIFEIGGKSAADGRAFLGVSAEKGYIGTSNGIFILNLKTNKITGRIAGTENPLITGDEKNADGDGPLYKNQIGMMILAENRVFAVQQDKGILVINPFSDAIESVINGCFSTVVKSKDGAVWAARNVNEEAQNYPYGMIGEKWLGTELLRINPATLETKAFDLTLLSGDDELMVEQTWYAWTAGSLCASPTENALFFTKPDMWDWFSKQKIFRFDIDNLTVAEFYDTKADKANIYGSGIRVSPSGEVWVSCFSGDNVSTNNWAIFRLDKNGKKLATYTPIKNYWYPALFIFPEEKQEILTAVNLPILSKNKAIAQNGKIRIFAFGKVVISDLLGRVIFSENVEGEKIVSVQQGIYLVKINNQQFKLNVK